ncbi:HlyD family secretion protein [Shimia marina]|uniref:Inner membrane protein YiaV n=1 Tax=Shimia marina TaxID=321267 RepID=A0A0P1FAX2_9RHOB|nr:biotin/lipoyl-binding protein [Shimia marina]CUH53433.1 Inner membrane protein YiaV precursor [Shimia marina]SFD77072.1 Multidrug resistance efflux pump [Shimia marina]
MLEFICCSMLTIFPDYLFRRYWQGKRLGQDITLFSMWYELRYGLSSCFILTVSLITVIFYFHPATSNVSSYFRTVTILPEISGRVVEVAVKNNQDVKAGDMIFRLDDSRQRAAVATARAAVVEVDAGELLARDDLRVAQANLDAAEAAFEQTKDEFERKNTLFQQNSPAVTVREVERLENLIQERLAAVDAAHSAVESAKHRVEIQLPAQRDSAMAALKQAEVELSKMVIYAGQTGRIEQFDLRVGDYINPILRPAGILVPADTGRGRFQAGFGQLTTQVLHKGMLAEMSCVSAPMRVTPMVIVDVQDVIPSGQVRPSDTLRDPQNAKQPGSVIAYLEPLYEGGTDHLPPGSKCEVNAYTNNHERLQDPELGTGTFIALHVIDTVGYAHALILRFRAILLPFKVLVFSGHH